MLQHLAVLASGHGTRLARDPPMNVVIQTLLKIQALEFTEVPDSNSPAEIQELRTQVPTQILAHYDRLRIRGKKGVALVRNKSCTGCHLQQPLGKITVLMRNEDIQLCDSCGRYLFLAPEPETPVIEPVIVKKPVTKTTRVRKPKPLPVAT
jgi:hypothetical protein